jgi:hypothetical protein
MRFCSRISGWMTAMRDWFFNPAKDDLDGFQKLGFLSIGMATARWMIEFPHAQHELFRLFH